MTEYVIRSHGSLFHPEVAGQYLVTYDPEANDGMGAMAWSADVSKARRFPAAVEAMKCWRQVPVSRPVRDDGHRNRPLTAHTIEIVPLEEDGTPRRLI